MSEQAMGFWQTVAANALSGLVVAAVAAAALVVFWGRIRQRILVDVNRIPLVEVDLARQVVRNIGSETALNGQLFFMQITGKKRADCRLIADLPNLTPGESQEVKAIGLCGVVIQEVYLLQYSNATGTLFQALIEDGDAVGHPAVMHPPRRIPAWREHTQLHTELIASESGHSETTPYRLPRWSRRRITRTQRLRKRGWARAKAAAKLSSYDSRPPLERWRERAERWTPKAGSRRA